VQPSSPDSWHVICLCAAWCGVCRDWRPVLRDLARAHPQWHIAWIDVEDEDEAMGEVEVETFPTLLVAHGGEPRFFGPVPPSAAQLEHLVTRLQARAEPPLAEGTRALLRRLEPLLPQAAL
jgi:thioredoxin-like negative regulator of GroEL